MRILHVIPGLDPMLGGPSEAVRHLARETAKLGHEVDVYATALSLEPGFEFSAEAEFAPARVKVFPVVNVPHVLAFSLPLLKALARKIPRVDVVHIHSLYFLQNAWAALLCRRHGKPYLVRPHGTLDPYIRSKKWWLKAPYYHLIERWVLDHAAALHFTTEEEMRLTQDLGLKAPGIVVPNGIPDEAFIPGDPELFLQKYPQLRGRRIILFLSRLHEKKGLDLLIPAFAQIANTLSDVDLVIAGPDDGYEATAKRLVSGNGLESRCHFLGMLAGALKRAAFAASTCFVLTSYSENFGIAVTEALAQRVPVIVSDKVNVAGDLLKNHAGLVTACDSMAVEAVLKKVLDDAELRLKISNSGFQLVGKKYKWSACAVSMESVYCAVGRKEKRDVKG